MVTCPLHNDTTTTPAYVTLPARECPQPIPPPNGKIHVEQYTAGSVAQVTCDPGYQVSGPPVIICQEDGIWSAGPVCQRKFYQTTHHSYFVLLVKYSSWVLGASSDFQWSGGLWKLRI